MTVHSFQKTDIMTFVNKILQDMRSSFRVEAVEDFKVGDSEIKFAGNEGKLTAKISDFFLGDIGFSAFEVEVGNKKLNYLAEKQPPMSARILPSEADHLTYYTALKGPEAARKSLSMINAVCKTKLESFAQVIKDGEVMSLAKFETLRHRPTRSNTAAGLSMG
ncbi:MAG: hypothetical protein RSG77_19490 [Hafnia sp.]